MFRWTTVGLLSRHSYDKDLLHVNISVGFREKIIGDMLLHFLPRASLSRSLKVVVLVVVVLETLYEYQNVSI